MRKLPATVAYVAFILFALHAANSMKNIPKKRIQLNLTSYLRIFENCSVHIAQAFLDASAYSYGIEKLSFPIVYTEYQFNYTTRYKYADFRCRGHLFEIKRHQEFPSKSSPFYSLACEVIVYIIPPECDTWTPVSEYSELIPHADFDIRNFGYEYKPGEQSPLRPFMFRSGRYFIAVGPLEVLSPPICENMLRIVDNKNLQDSLFLPTRLYLEIELVRHACIFDVVCGSVQIKSVIIVRHPTFDTINTHVYTRTFDNTFDAATAITATAMSLNSIFYAFYSINMLLLDSFNDLEEVMASSRFEGQLIWGIYFPRKAVRNVELRHPYFLETGIGNSTLDMRTILVNLIEPNISKIFPGNSYPFLPGFSVDETTYYIQFVRVDSKGHYFVTCSPIVDIGAFSLIGYVCAFDFIIWTLLFIFSLALTFMFRLEMNFKVSAESILFGIATLLEQGMGLSHRYKRVTAAWLIMGIIFSNAYKGDNITKLTAPLSVTKLDYFQQLVNRNFSFLSMLEPQWHDGMYEMLLKMYTIPTKYQEFYPILFGNSSFKRMVTRFEKAYGVYNPWHNQSSMIIKVGKRIYNPKSLFENVLLVNWTEMVRRIGNCEQMAFIDGYKQVYRMHLDLKAKFDSEGNQTFKDLVDMSKDTPGGLIEAWTFSGLEYPVTKFIKRVHSITASGIDEAWRKWSFRVATWRETARAARQDRSWEPKKLSLEGNVRVVFFVYLVSIGISLIPFIVECGPCCA